ncbi:cytochrome P450 [Embleya sp. AB8]|uniref:cytochrome P450 n=1 Tax=Embleya sp. AB8 TaxID=3156304 RepID=UPI003C73A5DB
MAAQLPPRHPMPPGRIGRAPGAWPVAGHLPHLMRAPLRFLGSLPAYGDLVEIRIGSRPTFVLCHPELARQVMSDGHTFDRLGPVYDGSRAAMGNGLATCLHAEHRRQRILLQPAFRTDHLSDYADVMRRDITAMVRRWRPGAVLDMVDEMFALTTTTAVHTLFGSGIGAHDLADLRDNLDVYLRGVYLRVLLPAMDSLPTPGSRRYRRSLAAWQAHVTRIIAERRAAGATGADDTDGRDLLGRLLAARDEAGEPLTEDELRDQVAVLILAGAETTSSALAWSLHLLAAHPEAEAALHAEVDAVLGGRVAEPADLPHLDRTRRVLYEALRLYPPAWALTRTGTRAVEVAGRRLPEGTTFLFSPYILHRHPDFHPDPECFRPDRDFADDAGTEGPWARSTFVPFGIGPTKCIGDDFAVTEATLALASIASRWRLRPASRSPIRAAPRSLLTPRTLPMRLIRR